MPVIETVNDVVVVEVTDTHLTIELGSAGQLLAGTGLEGGGPLDQSVTIGLNPASQASLALADTALQDADIGVTVQAHSTNLDAYAAAAAPSGFTLNLVDLPDAPSWQTQLEVYSNDQVDALLAGLSSIYQVIDPQLTAYAGGDTPSAFTLGIVDGADAAAWRTNLGVYSTSEVDGIVSGLSAVYQPLSSELTAYAGGDTPSAFTLGIVDSADAAAWRTALAIPEYDVFTDVAAGLVPASGGGTSTFLRADGTFATPSGSAGGDPTAEVGLIAVNGTDGAYMRANAAPALSQAITPTWTGLHTFSTTPVIPDDSWGFAKIQNVATSTILGRVTAGAGNIETLTGTQATTLLDVFTPGLKGLVPASGGGTANFLSAAGTWIAPAGGVTGLANPLVSIGLTAVNGSATTAMRSDAAPALSQSITPTWTGTHTFTGVPTAYATSGTWASLGQTSNYPALTLRAGAAATNTKLWQHYVDASSGSYVLSHLDDAASTQRAVIAAAKSGSTLSSITFGNSTDNPTYTFYGTGVISGVGSGLTALNASNLASGTVDTARLGSNTANGNLFLRGDSTWANALGSQLILNFNNISDEVLHMRGTSPYIAFYNTTGSARQGYIQKVTSSVMQFVIDGAYGFDWYSNSAQIMTLTSGGTLTAPILTTSSGAVYTYTGIYWNQNNAFYIFNTSGYTYGSWRIGGSNGGYCGIVLDSNAARATFMMRDSDGLTGIYRQGGTYPGWLFYDDYSSFSISRATTAPSFQATSSREIKTEIRMPTSDEAKGIIKKLRTIVYRLKDKAAPQDEQLGYIAEEVHEICPWLSPTGKAVMYDRIGVLAVLAMQGDE